MCQIPGLDFTKVSTYFPSQLEGIGMECRPLTFADYEAPPSIGGKLFDVLKWLLEL